MADIQTIRIQEVAGVGGTGSSETTPPLPVYTDSGKMWMHMAIFATQLEPTASS
jgi:hypothetical protein